MMELNYIFFYPPFLMSSQSSTSNFASERSAQEIEKFFEKTKFNGIEKTLKLSVEKIRQNEAWLDRDSRDIEAFLNADHLI